jgi:hypothetical protein
MSDSNYKPVTVGDWMITALLLGIPIVNIVLIFVWAFGGNTPVSKANFAKATLIWCLISMVISFVLIFVFGFGAALLGAAVSGM